MIQDINKYIDFLIDNDINHEQFVFCYILYLDSLEYDDMGKRKFPKSGPSVANIWRYAKKFKSWPKELLEDLVHKGFVKHKGRSKKFSPDMLEVTEKFTDQLFAGMDQFEEFWETYPGFVENFDHPAKQKVRLKAVDKDALEKRYYKIVTTHHMHNNRVMPALKWAKKNGEINMNIKNWLTSRQWEAHEEEMSGSSNSSSNELIQ